MHALEWALVQICDYYPNDYTLAFEFCTGKINEDECIDDCKRKHVCRVDRLDRLNTSEIVGKLSETWMPHSTLAQLRIRVRIVDE